MSKTKKELKEEAAPEFTTQEAEQNLEWNARRVLTRMNYKMHTNAVKEYIIPKSALPADQLEEEYKNEADLLNLALFGCTSKEWKAIHPEWAAKGKRLRDTATIGQLTVLSNIESINAVLMKKGISKEERLLCLKEIAATQLKNLEQLDQLKAVDSPGKKSMVAQSFSSFDKYLGEASTGLAHMKPRVSAG